MSMYINGRPLPGLSISGRHTYTYWEMIPTSRLHVVSPETKTTYIDLPGANGGLDYTELLTGGPTYGYRKGSWEFMLIPGEQWSSVYEDLCNYLHGREHTIVLDDDNTHYYQGRLKVSEWKSQAYNSLITIEYVLNPNRYDQNGIEDAHDAIDLQGATRLLLKPENAGKIIKLEGNLAVLAEP